MNAFIALEKYIVKEEKDFGVGVPVTCNEDIAKYESTRKRNVQSYNNWLLISIPGNSFYIDALRPVKEQSDDVLSVFMDKEFLMSLFIHEAKKVLNDMEPQLAGKNVREESNRIFDNFVKEQYEKLLKFNSGLELFNFINSKCIEHDKGKSSALLYNHGVKGMKYTDDTGERFLLFNAKKDIQILEFRNAMLTDSKMNM